MIIWYLSYQKYITIVSQIIFPIILFNLHPRIILSFSSSDHRWQGQSDVDAVWCRAKTREEPVSVSTTCLWYCRRLLPTAARSDGSGIQSHLGENRSSDCRVDAQSNLLSAAFLPSKIAESPTMNPFTNFLPWSPWSMSLAFQVFPKVTRHSS